MRYYIDMAERPTFGEPVSQARHKNLLTVVAMFPDATDLPIFSGTPIAAIEQPFLLEDHSMKQGMLPGMPKIDYDHVLEKDKALRRRGHKGTELPPSGDLFVAPPMDISPQQEAATPLPEPAPDEPTTNTPEERPPRQRTAPGSAEAHQLREALAPYLDYPHMRQLAAVGADLTPAFRDGTIPPDFQPIFDLYKVLFHPAPREQIKSPADVAALLMVEMGYLDQEELRTVLLDTKNRLQGIVTVYKGSLNTSMVRVGEVYKEAVRRNSAALIVAHNHPSSDPTPSPEDVAVTREIVQAGELLDIECLDHLVIGKSGFVSLKERGLWPQR